MYVSRLYSRVNKGSKVQLVLEVGNMKSRDSSPWSLIEAQKRTYNALVFSLPPFKPRNTKACIFNPFYFISFLILIDFSLSALVVESIYLHNTEYAHTLLRLPSSNIHPLSIDRTYVPDPLSPQRCTNVKQMPASNHNNRHHDHNQIMSIIPPSLVSDEVVVWRSRKRKRHSSPNVKKIRLS